MKTRIFAAAALLTLSAATLGEAPPKAASCEACHGQGGVSINPEWPNLAGQKEIYLVNQLTAFRDGERENALMAPMIAGLTDKDIQELTAHYANQPISTAANRENGLMQNILKSLDPADFAALAAFFSQLEP